MREEKLRARAKKLSSFPTCSNRVMVGMDFRIRRDREERRRRRRIRENKMLSFMMLMFLALMEASLNGRGMDTLTPHTLATEHIGSFSAPSMTVVRARQNSIRENRRHR